MRRSANSSPRPSLPSIPDGWFPIHPTRTQSPHEATNYNSHVDGLGLAKGVDAAAIHVPHPFSNNTLQDERARGVRSSPRHRRLQQTHHQEPNELPLYTAADAFAPNRSLRLASIKPRLDKRDMGYEVLTLQPQQRNDADDGSDPFTRRSPKAGTLSARSRAARLRETHAPSVMPLHEVVRGFDDAVDASPQAESNQVAVTELFVASWMERFERERGLYKSIVLHAEIAFRELYRMTANLASPNDVVTAFACKILDDMTEHFGPYATIVRVLSSELCQAIYATPSTPSVGPPVPYYAIVKNQKRILISLRKDQLRRQERNDFLRYEIDRVHETFLHFLDECGLGLVRTIFHEWYSVAVVSKRNTKKYIEYYSAWFGGSAKAMVPRLFLAWKCLSVETKVARMHEQLTLDQAKLASVQKQIEDFTVQRNLAQLESLAVRNDRKHAEDTIQRLHRKIQSASAFLEDTPRREALVAHEAQLRVEAATFLPPLVLESLLRGFHSVGFLQPLHSEFAGAKEGQLRRQTNPQLLGREHQQAFAMDGSALSQCIAALGRGHAATDGRENDLVTREIPLHDCVNYVQGIKLRVEDDPTAYLLFLPKAELAKAKSKSMAHRSHEKDNEDIDATAPTHKSPFRFQELVRQFNMALQNVRHQDEHYARHTKLFSSRMLEQSEITIVPYAPFSPQTEPPVSPQRHTSVQLPVSHQRVLYSSIDSARVAGSTYVVRGSVGEQDDTGDSRPLDHLPLLQPHDLELSPQQTRAFIVLTLGQLLIEYGSLLFSPTDLTAFVRNRMLHKIMLRGIAGGKHTLKRIYVPIPTDTEYEGGSVSDGSSSNDDDKDDDVEDKEQDNLPTHSPKGTADTDKAAKGSDRMALLRKQATQRRMEVAPRRMSSYRGLHAPIADEIDRGLSHLKTAYDVWNRLTPQLTSNNVAAPATSALLDPRASVNGSIGGDGIASFLATPENSSTPFVALRPRLQLYVEPLPSGPLMTSAKERDRSETPSSSHRRSVMTMSPAPDWSYETSKVRHLSLTDTQQLVHAVQGLHAIVRSTAQQRAVTFTAAKKNLRILRATQWHHACDLASHFTCSVSSVATTAISPVTEIGTISEASEDDRREVFECVTFENDAIERLFSVEDNPADELERVQMLLERKNHLVRHAFYCKHRPGTTHAASLDELCHVVKVLRLPRDVHVLPQLRDDELISTSYFGEHLFSPDDVAEVVLQLCNEQFLPQLTPLSARVEFFLTHHVPLAMQKPSAIREVMHTADVKKALSDHSYTLRTIFRRYCAKERDLLAAAAAKRRAAVVTTAANAAIYATSSSTTPAPAPPVVASAAPPGITKFMRLADWHDFIADYKLLRARFTIEYATVVFCNVQEAESGLEDDLEMIFSEFSEAIVALAVCYFPDPFLRHATRVHQFIRRYVPVSPEDTRDHHS